MKFLAGLVAFFILFGFFGISSGQTETSGTNRLSDSGAQGPADYRVTFTQNLQKNPEIFIQIEVRDSNGQLVGYTEGNPQIFYLKTALKWVEPLATKKIIMKDGERTELLQYEYQISIFEAQSSAAYYLKLPVNGKTVQVLHFYHDSYHLLPGDTVTIHWTILR